MANINSTFFIDRRDRGRLRLTGRDRQSFLQGMVTNDVASLTPGQGCYALMLDATGHVLADMRVLCAENHLLLDVEPGRAAFVAETLDKYLIMEKVRITDVTQETAQVFVGGTGIAELLERWGVAGADEWREGQNATVAIGDAEEALIAATRLIPGPGFDIYLPDAAAKDALLATLGAAGLSPLSADTLEALRIEAGIPRLGVDMDEKALGPETGQQARAISYRKGCYIGQEIVARIHARGHTNRGLTGFLLDSGDAPPASGMPVTVEGKEVGRVTSAAVSPTLGRPVALGYIRNEHATPGTAVEIDGRGATVAALPFVGESKEGQG